MKTLSDYHRKVLGLSLKGLSPKLSQQEHSDQETTPSPVPRKKIAFLASKKDRENQKLMIQKLLEAIQMEDSVFIDSMDEVSPEGTLFIFGVTPESEDRPETLVIKDHPTFTEISKNVDLKRQLWEDLKKTV